MKMSSPSSPTTDFGDQADRTTLSPATSAANSLSAPRGSAESRDFASTKESHGLAASRKKLGIGKARSDHQQCVAPLHQLPTRRRSQQADGASDHGQIVRHAGFTEQG